MLDHFPRAIPEVLVTEVHRAADYYVHALGFHLDWHSEEHAIAGISQGECCIFLTTPPAGKRAGDAVVWLNLLSRQEVDELHQRWQSSGARILEAPQDKPWNLHEFKATDLDGNVLRVYHDFTWETRSHQR
jgi:predicted lactoylglutathione lyase